VRIFSGIQPTGRKHLGNYIGAIRQYVAGQDRGDPAIYCIVNLHAITVPYEPPELQRAVLDTTAMLLAAGLDPARCILFRQGDVHEHTELCWLLTSVTAHGELNRMTQFKEKSARQRELVSAGLFLYPVLQAADVLGLSGPRGAGGRRSAPAHRVDARDRHPLQRAFRRDAGGPRAPHPEVGARIMDLQSPQDKMSTTASTEQGTLYVLDDEKAITKKIKSAVTDSGSDIRVAADKPGISNLIEVLAVIRDVDHDAIEREFDGQQYGAFKQAVADELVDFLRPIRERYEELRPDEAGLERTLAEGAERAHALASETLRDVRAAMGVGGE
jgi:tryptophanyl-tRNA synthetase